MWEFYCNRYEILEELLGKLALFTRRNSVHAVAIMGVAFVSAEVLARLGVLGEDNNKGLWNWVTKSKRFQEGVPERALQKTSSVLMKRGVDSLRLFRRFGGKSKFAISVGVGAMCGTSIIRLTTFAVRAVLISFFVLETLSFLGVIGEQGETILDWIDDQRDNSAPWVKKFAMWHKEARSRLNFEWLESFYKAAVDEEKIAVFGFSVGTVTGILT